MFNCFENVFKAHAEYADMMMGIATKLRHKAGFEP